MPLSHRPYRAHRRLDDESLRKQKAQKILAILDEIGMATDAQCCLDVGCAYGLITKHLAEQFRYTVGLEYGADALQQARCWRSPSLTFVQGDGLALPMADASVDVVVCAQVYEHVDDPKMLFAEIWRVLTPGGTCIFSGPNRLFPYEFHSRLPFVHWLPFPWTRRLVRTLGGGPDYDARMLGIGSLRRLLQRFQIHDVTVAMLRDPERYACSAELGRFSWIGRLPERLLHGILFCMPNFNWVLRKPIEPGDISA